MKNHLISIVFVCFFSPLFADEIVEDFETGTQDPFNGTSNLTWIGDVGDYKITSSTWPSYVSFDFAGSYAIRSKDRDIADTTTILIDITSVYSSSKKIRWEIYLSGNSAKITTGSGASLILFSNSNNISDNEKGTINGYRIRLCDPSGVNGWEDGLYLEKANGIEWTMIDSVHTGDANINMGYNVAVERTEDGVWAWGYSNGSVGNPVSLTESILDDDYINGIYSGVQWYSSGGDAKDFGFDNFKVDPYTPNLWKSEATSSNWLSASNWDDGIVPSASSSIQIEAGLNQPIVGSNIDCENLILEPGAQITINNGFSLSVNGDFTLQSDTDGTASIIDNGTINVVGDSNIQRYMECFDPDAENEYHFLSIPINNHAVENSLLNYYVYPYDETQNAWAFLSSGDQVMMGKGYSAYYSADNDHCIVFSGVPNTGDKMIPITSSNFSGTSSSDNWNLIGNPFPSPIDWDLVTKDNIESAIYIWNAETCTYASYVSGVGTNFNDDGIIPAMQGFFVHASSTGNITIPQSARIHNVSQDYLMKNNTLNQRLKIQLKSQNYSDECVIRFINGASEQWDTEYDALKFLSGKIEVPQISSLIYQEIQSSINSLSAQGDLYEIPLLTMVNENGFYDLCFRDVATLLTDYKIFLNDKISGENFEILKDSCYQLNLTSELAEQFVVRFERELTDIEEVIDEEIIISSSIYGGVEINKISREFMGGELSVIAMDGKSIYSAEIDSENMQFDIYQPGLYVIRFKSSNMLFSKKIIIL